MWCHSKVGFTGSVLPVSFEAEDAGALADPLFGITLIRIADHERYADGRTGHPVVLHGGSAGPGLVADAPSNVRTFGPRACPVDL